MDCISKQTDKIVTEYEINGIKIVFEQRLLTKKENDIIVNSGVDIMKDKDVFKTLLKQENNEELDDEAKYVIHNASKKIERAKIEIETKLISFSCKPNVLYGGYIKVKDKNLKFEEYEDFISELDSSIYDKLLDNAYKLQNPTEEEINDAK